MAKNVVGTVTELVTPFCEEFGYLLWDVEYVKEGGRKILRITIDSEDGITVDDCEKLHRAIDPALDEADPIDEPYYLEVSSPGVERELRTKAHLDAFAGSEVEVRLFAALNGQKQFRGILGECDDETVRLRIGTGDTAEEKTFPKKAVSKIRTVFDF